MCEDVVEICSGLYENHSQKTYKNTNILVFDNCTFKMYGIMLKKYSGTIQKSQSSCIVYYMINSF